VKVLPCSVAAGLAAVALIQVSHAQPFETGRPEIILHGPNPHFGAAPTAGSTSAVKPAIQYRGGPVMGAQTPTAYVIFYGAWPTGSDFSNGRAIIQHFLSTIGGSSYFNINTTYSISTTAPGKISGLVNFGGELTLSDPYLFGPSLTDSQILDVVADALRKNPSPDPNGVYFVLTSADVTASSGFCTRYCGWHARASLQGVDVKYSFVGDSARCITACAAQGVSPNGNPGVDGMISVIAHELEETVTDPDLNAWFDAKGYENADKCAWTFGNTVRDPKGAYYNITLPSRSSSTTGTRNYLIQRNLVRAKSGDYCASGWDGVKPLP